MTVNDIKEMALGFGACDLIYEADSIKSLIDVIQFKSTIKPLHAIVMHGANAKVIAPGYSLFQIVNIGGDIETHESKNASIYRR